MRDLIVLAIGMIVGNWGPPLIAWLLTRTERNERRVGREKLEQLIADVHQEPAGGLAVPPQVGRHHVRRVVRASPQASRGPEPPRRVGELRHLRLE